MLNFLFIDGGKLLGKCEKFVYLQNIVEVVERNVILYNILDDSSFYTLEGNLSNFDIQLEILIYADSLNESLKIAKKIVEINKPFRLKINEENFYFVTIPLVLKSANTIIKNEDDTVLVRLSCKPYIKQKMNKFEALFGLTRDGLKWVKLLESVIMKIK